MSLIHLSKDSCLLDELEKVIMLLTTLIQMFNLYMYMCVLCVLYGVCILFCDCEAVPLDIPAIASGPS